MGDELGLLERRATWRGLDDGMSQAVEMAVVPVLLSLFGLFLDRRLGTLPWLTVTLAVLAMVGTFVRAYFAYQAKMEHEEEARPWAKRG